jgi:hypothetical protein
MRLEPERPAVVEADDLEDAVAAQQPLVGDRDLRVGGVHHDAVEDRECGLHRECSLVAAARTDDLSLPPRGDRDAPARNRTWNLRIKSPLLCQLSYRGW